MKTCSKCKVEKDEGEYYKKAVLKDGLSNACKKCINVQNRSYAVSNRDRVNSIKKKHRNSNKIKAYEYCKEWRKLNPDRYKIIWIKAGNKAVEKISNSYAINVLKYKGFSIDQITPDLLEVQKLTIKIKRHVKQKKAVNN